MSHLQAVPSAAPRDHFQWSVRSTTFVNPNLEPGHVTVTPTSAPYTTDYSERQDSLQFKKTNGNGHNVIELASWVPGDADRPTATVLLTETQAREMQAALERAIRTNARHAVDEIPDFTIVPDELDTLKYLAATLLSDIDSLEDALAQDGGPGVINEEWAEAVVTSMRNRIAEALSAHTDISDPVAHQTYSDGTHVSTHRMGEGGMRHVYYHKPGTLR